MNTIYKTICGVVGAAVIAGCTSSPRIAQFDYVRPDQCLCKSYGVACKYHSPSDKDNETNQKTLIADTRK